MNFIKFCIVKQHDLFREYLWGYRYMLNSYKHFKNSPALDRLRNWPNFKVLFLQRKAMLLQELFWQAGEKEIWKYDNNKEIVPCQS